MAPRSESSIQTASGSRFVTTWTGSANNLEEHYGAVTLVDVDQTSPVGSVAFNTSTSNPIQLASTLTVSAGDMVVCRQHQRKRRPVHPTQRRAA